MLAGEMATPYPTVVRTPLSQAADLMAAVRIRQSDKPRLM